MVKNKSKYFYFIIVSLIICLSVFLVFRKLLTGNNYFTIQNLSHNVATNVRIEYSNGDSTVIGKLAPLSEYKLKLTESVNETAVSVVYTDNQGVIHKEIVVGYLVLAENLNYDYKIR
jgi:hypothetical protein